jgi:hypothetical protein
MNKEGVLVVQFIQKTSHAGLVFEIVGQLVDAGFQDAVGRVFVAFEGYDIIEPVRRDFADFFYKLGVVNIFP